MQFTNGISSAEFVAELENALDKTGNDILKYIEAPVKSKCNMIEDDEFAVMKNIMSVIPSLQIFLLYHGFQASNAVNEDGKTAMLNYAFGKIFPDDIYKLGEQLCSYDEIMRDYEGSNPSYDDESRLSLKGCKDLDEIASNSKAMQYIAATPCLDSLVKASSYAFAKLSPHYPTIE